MAQVRTAEVIYRGSIRRTGEVIESTDPKFLIHCVMMILRSEAHDAGDKPIIDVVPIDYGVELHYDDNSGEFIPYRTVCYCFCSGWNGVVHSSIERSNEIA